MKELQQDTIDQIRTLFIYMKEKDLLKNKDILMYLNRVEKVWRRSSR